MAVEPVTTFSSGDTFVYGLTGWGHYVAWAAGDRSGKPANRVVVYDLRTRRKRIVARATASLAQIDAVRGSRDAIVYSELARTPNDQIEDGLNVPWSDYVIDLATGRTERILTSRNDRRGHPILPTPRIDWPWVIEEVLSAGQAGGLDVMIYNLETKEWKRRITSVHQGSGFDLDRGSIIYDARSSNASNEKARDILLVPADGSVSPRQMSHSGEVVDNVSANGGTSWHEPANGAPQSMWWLDRSYGAKPVRFADGGYSPYPGEGFVVWIPTLGDRLLVKDPLSTSGPIQLAGEDLDLGAQWSAFDDCVVWATRTNVQAPIVHVVRMLPHSS